MGIQISHRYDIGLNPIVCLICNASCEDHCMCSLHTKVPRPEFGSFDCGSVNDELVSNQIKSCRRLQPRNIWAMTKLSLCIAPNDLPVVDKWLVVANLIRTSKLNDTLGKHLHVQGHWVCPWKHVVPVEILALLPWVVYDKVLELLVSHNHFEAIPPLLYHFLTCLIIILEAAHDLRVLFYQSVK